MRKRHTIKNIIIDSWKASIRADYLKQRINSERSLQASLWSQLNKKLPSNRRLFIEPPMRIWARGGYNKVYPDIVICSKKEVISVIELKYLPRAQPKYEKDIDTMALISRKRKQVSISNSRFRGSEVDSRDYTLSNNILFVWAGIHATPKKEITRLYSSKYKSLDGCFVQLHAETQHDDKPIIYHYE